MRGWSRRVAVVLLILLGSAAYTYAQWGYGREGSFAPVFPPADFRAPSFTFCRLMSPDGYALGLNVLMYAMSH